jgi:hypothetical protein
MRLGPIVTTLAFAPTLFGAALSRARRHREPRLTVSSLTYLETYGPGDKVKVYRGAEAHVTVKGHLVDLSTGVEARTAGGAATTDPFPFTGDRVGGDNSSIVVGVAMTDQTPLGAYQVLLHYLVETSGPDKFQIQVFDSGKIDDISIVEPAEANGFYLTGKQYTLRATGSHLENAALFVAKTGISGLTTTATQVSSSSISKTFPIKFTSGGAFTIDATDFFDLHLPAAPPTSCVDECYTGNGKLSFQVVAVPVIASVSSTAPAAGSTVTIAGSGLSSPGLSSEIRAVPRYGSPNAFVPATTSISNTGLTFAAQAGMRQDSIMLVYRPLNQFTGPPTFAVRLPNIAVQGGAPQITQIDTAKVASGKRYVLPGGVRTLLGQFLAPNPLAPTLIAIDPNVINSIPKTLPTSVQLAGASTAPATPTIKFGQNDLDVSLSRYFPTAVIGVAHGVDSVKFGMINFTDTISKTLTVTTPFGSVSVPNVLAVPPPTIAFIRRTFSTGQPLVVNDGVLLRGVNYDVGGVGLILTTSGAIQGWATIKLNGQIINPGLLSAAPGSTMPFGVPTTAALGPGTLSLETVAGSVSRSITIQDKPPVVSIVGFQASPSDVVGGQTITGTVAFNAPIAAGTTAATLVVTQSPATPSPLNLPAPILVHANPTVFTVTTRVTRAPVTATILVKNADSSTNGGPPNTASATVTVRPPSPTSLTLSTANVVGGQSLSATVQMTGGAATLDSIPITFTTDDPTTVTIPQSVLLNGSSATIQIGTHVVPVSRTATITATAGGQSRSATITVAPPTIVSVTPNPSSTLSPSTVPVTVTLTAALPSAQTATVACSGQGLTCPTSVSISGSAASFNVTTADVPTPRTGTITVTFNGVSTSGSLDIQPLAVQTITVSPASVAAGASSSFTMQLNRAPGVSLTFQFSSSDPTVVHAPAAVTFGTNDVTKLVTVNTVAPQGTAKTVTITATANRSTAFGPATITKTATLIVNP